MVLSDNWTISDIESAPKVEVKNGKRSFSWPVNLMWLADRTNSNSICTGQYKEVAKELLGKLQASMRNRPLIIELVSVESGSRFVAGLWLFNAEAGFERGGAYGSPAFGWTPEQVKSFGTTSVYEQKAKEMSDKNWAKLHSESTK